MAEQSLKWILRWIGTASLTAIAFVAAPRSWMVSIHADLGLGALPDAPIVGYLARSTSAFYALVGGLLWVVSFDLPRHRAVLTYLGCAVTVLGVALFAIDYGEGLPAFWTFWEGPFVTLMGIAILTLSRQLPAGDPVP